jgi:DNA-binding response OmpR family regulator
LARHRTVLVVEADPDLRDAIESLLARNGYHTVGTGCGLRAVELASEHRVAVAVVGLLLPGQSGFQVLAHLKARHGDAVRVVMTSEVASAAPRDLALASGAERFLPKPLAVSQLLDAVAAFLPPAEKAAEPRRMAHIGA